MSGSCAISVKKSILVSKIKKKDVQTSGPLGNGKR